MLNILHAIEAELPNMLRDTPDWTNNGGWNTVEVDYHPPFVDRLWRQCGDCRVYLHKIYPCEVIEALFHPHPWPSAMHILEGSYEMAIGYGKGMETPPIAARILCNTDFRYEMTNPDAWHYVRPLGAPVYTVMVTGPVWKREAPRADRKLQPLPERKVDEMLEKFRLFFQ